MLGLIRIRSLLSIVSPSTRYQSILTRSISSSDSRMSALGSGEFPLRPLGTSNLLVTKVCLGSMTWGTQNTEAEAHEQLDYAIKERGINFIDTAELYPVFSSHPNWKPGLTEEYIGSWLSKNTKSGAIKRSDIVIATKVAGYSSSSDVPRFRTDPPGTEKMPCRLDAASINLACDASLRRLQTGYIDLYQIHWPDRYLPSFGNSVYNPNEERRNDVPIRETLLALKGLLENGKIRAYGLSNESTFGVCEYVRLADELGMPRPASIQNSFSLMNRAFETELAEACAPKNFKIGLLPWSILAGGSLTGKYLDNQKPEGCRFTMFPKFQYRFVNESSLQAVAKYKKIADEAGMSVATMSQAWVSSRFYVEDYGSCIIGASRMEHLKENIDACKIRLSPEVLVKIDEVHLQCRDPTNTI